MLTAKLVPGLLPDFSEAAHRLRNRDDSVADPRFDRIRGIDVFDVGSCEFEELRGIAVDQPRLVETAHELHVLLRPARSRRVGFALYGIALFMQGTIRARQEAGALGGEKPAMTWRTAALAAAGPVLGLAVVALIALA